MKACIGFGKSPKYMFYLLIAFVAKLGIDSLMGFNNNRDKKIKIFSFTPKIKPHYVIRGLINYLSAIFCGLILYLLRNKFEMKKKGEITYQEHQKMKDKLLNSKTESITKILLIIYLIYSFNDIIGTFLYSVISYFELWMLEIFFIVVLTSIIFHITIGIHIKISIFLISGILLVIRIISFSLPRTNHNCNTTEEECKIKYLEDNNTFIIIIRKFGSFYFIPIIFITYILIAIMRDYSWVKTKYLIDIKTVPLYKIFFYFGIIGIFVCVITLTSSTYIPYETLNNITRKYNDTTDSYMYFYSNGTKIKYTDFICKVRSYNNHTKELNIHYDNFFVFLQRFERFNSNDVIELFAIFPLFFIFNMVINFCNIMMIRHFDPNMLLVTDNFYYFVQGIIEFAVNEANEAYLTHKQFILAEVQELISIFANLIYLEIIELRFCKLDRDLKKSIVKRAEMECSILEKNINRDSNDSYFEEIKNNMNLKEDN